MQQVDMLRGKLSLFSAVQSSALLWSLSCIKHPGIITAYIAYLADSLFQWSNKAVEL